MVLGRKANFLLVKTKKTIILVSSRIVSQRMFFWVFPWKKFVFLPKTIFFLGNSWFFTPKPSFLRRNPKNIFWEFGCKFFVCFNWFSLGKGKLVFNWKSTVERVLKSNLNVEEHSRGGWHAPLKSEFDFGSFVTFRVLTFRKSWFDTVFAIKKKGR